jgi:DNA-binding NtrC family response regulator
MKMNALLHLDIDCSEDLKGILSEEGFEVHALFEKDHILEEVAKGHADIIFLSGSCSDAHHDAIATIQKIKELDPRIEIICMGPGESNAAAVEMIKYGAAACFGIPLEKVRIKEIINKVKENAHHRREIYQFETALHDKYTFSNMVSRNPLMLDIFSLIKRVASYYRSMLIMGDTGTGKEVLARALHNVSPASDEPFIVCNCSGLVENLIESELFGHVKGAFTGAVSHKKGLFEAAGSGTIFLDEIGHMPL